MRRYPGITPFLPDDAPVFRGRTTETQEVTNLLLTQKTLILFARSGIGKTSLLNAGVVPGLRQYGLYPVFIRFNEISSNQSTSSPSADDAVLRFMNQFASAYTAFSAGRARASAFSPQPTLWHMVQKNPFVARRDALIPVLVFDQFEEFFRTYPVKEQRVKMLSQLAELLSDTPPASLLTDAPAGADPQPLNLRVVFSIRADRLNLMQEVSEYLPFVMRTRYELNPMTRQQATQAIREPGLLTDAPYDTGPIQFPDAVLTDMLQGLQDGYSGDIESFQLQLLCSYLEDQYAQRPGGTNPQHTNTVLQADYGGIDGIQQINTAYFSDTINAITEQPRTATIGGLVTLLNDTGNRILREESQLSLPPAVKDALVDRRILKRDRIQGNTYYEISHDKIALALQQEKDRLAYEQQLERERADRRKRRKQVLVIGTVASVIGLLGIVAVVFGVRANQASRYANVQRRQAVHERVAALAARDTLRLTNGRLDTVNRQLTDRQTTLTETIHELHRASLSKAWDDYENARTLMRNRLFDKAMPVFPAILATMPNRTHDPHPPRPSIIQSYRKLEQLVEQAQRICRDMTAVQHLIEQAECLELNLQINCANLIYRRAQQRQQPYVGRYGVYDYPSGELSDKISATNADIARGILLGLNNEDLTRKYTWLNEQLLSTIRDSTHCDCNAQKRLYP